MSRHRITRASAAQRKAWRGARLAHVGNVTNPYNREPSKAELRAQLAEAIRNTANLAKRTRRIVP